ncbi:hypothetical protein BDW02DRAFT_596629 [Decorospora gaudefroyi]|uniref:Uncharacterized protein n=1 Tax=Decorospora gaudefroyi TaxID=184978 RepID=A0A6A5KRD5_9PLEO|nr:hypothetical protein BDW02DRAFT_596629 [Decorospora gaudefroyi]
MWKRLQGHVREKERHAQIGNPVLLETTYDEDQLRRNPNVADLQNSSYQHNAPPSQLSYSLSPQDPPNYRASEALTASSTYSQPSQDQYYYDNPTATSPFGYEDISPPSSPEPDQHLSSSSSQPRRFRSMRDVSPMDENRRKLEAEPRQGSHIPVLRRAPPVLQTGDLHSGPKQKFWEGKLAPNSKVKWDEYSGEPNSSGKAASVTPGSYAQGALSSDRRPMGYQVSVTGPEKRNVSLGERVGRFGTRSSPPPVEPWSRATGRSEIAPPLKYQPASKPVQVPRKAISPTAERTDQEGSNALAAAMDRAPKLADTHPVRTETRDYSMHNNDIKPIVPLKVGKTSPPRSGLTSPTSPVHQGLGISTFRYPSPITPTARDQQESSPVTTLNTPIEATLHPAHRTATPPYTTVERKSEDTPEKDKQPPTSRFSWTTYNSATTYQHSPPPSPPPPPLPSAKSAPAPKPRVVTEPISAASSILSRRRPVPHADRFPEPVPTPKPVSETATGMAKIRSPDPISPSSASTFSTLSTNTSKALPRPPPTLSASDHISLLESQQEDLRIRRNNVYRLLSDLNNAAPPNPLITDFKKSRLVEQRKKAFEDELYEIKREEHDVGLKLHRAWKKREREDPGAAGSALWVRRVTS